ncbi:hypothetical protein HY837_03520 [archaeon]|nr:hypothetical protein [archaeon]
MKPKLLNEVSVTNFEVKELLTKLKKDNEELTFRAQKTFEHLETVVTLKKSQVEELQSELAKLKISRLRDQHINKIIDILPNSAEQLKVVMQAYPVSLKQEDLKKIADVVKKVVG